MKLPLISLLSAALLVASITAGAQSTQPTNAPRAPVAQPTAPVVGGAAMLPTKNIVENASLSQDHTTLVAAVRAADLDGALQTSGPYTVFAPTNAAFAQLPAGAVDNLLMPKNKQQLKDLLNYHVVAGRLDAKTLDEKIRASGGMATLTTLEGEQLTVSGVGRDLTITDAQGQSAQVTISDVYQKNGVIQVVDKVLMPATK